LLAAGGIDVGPCSSIEYAVHPDRYSILPDLVIGARGAVRSIILVAAVPPEGLDDLVVAIPTASATSVVLLKILLKKRWGVSTRFRWFDQSREDPFAGGASAALFIGDVALRPDRIADGRLRFDLGTEWWETTELPFAFAVWQVASTDPRVGDLHATLLESRRFGEENRSRLAGRYASYFKMTPEELERYWGTLIYDLDEAMVAGLETFYQLAFEIGELPGVPKIRWWSV
jgi:chorismate dehydratase